MAEKKSKTSDEKGLTMAGRNGGTLRRFQKGESGNPNGRPAGTKNFATIMKKILEQPTTIEIDGENVPVTRAEALIFEQYKIATESGFDAVRLRAISDIFDRLEGRPVPAVPEPDQTESETVILYIPNSNSRKRAD